jgi:hypothetical protein
MAEEEKIAQALRSVLEEFFPKRLKQSQNNGGEQREPPFYNTTLGKFLEFTAKDRQTYTDVLTQIYPLAADIGALKLFCKEFLYHGCDDPWTFEPAGPWVVMQVCNYGKMAMQSQKYGWVSQHELAFGFPVAWYENGPNGQRKFKDWAMFYPYIYVDEPLSMSLAHQVYGWAKAGMELMSPRPNLQPDIRCLVSIDLKGGPGGSRVNWQTKSRFLEVLQHQPLLSGRSGFATLYSLPARAMGIYLSAANAMLGTFNSMIRGSEGRLSNYADSYNPVQGLITESVNLTSQTRQWNDFLRGLLPSARDLTLAQERVLGMPVTSEGIENILKKTDGKLRIVTRKQFLDAAKTDQACFSAIVLSTMDYGQPIDGAPFISDPLSPDPSGGIQINLRDPRIVKHLGLETYGTLNDGVHMLRPVMPFWVKLNATYGSADCQEWRTRNTNWVVDSMPATPSGGGVTPEQTRPIAKIGAATDLPYKRGGSDAFEEVPGPMQAANFGLWIYGLKADKGTLNNLCQEYLKNQDKDGNQIYKFEVSLPPKELLPERDFYVLMIVSSFDSLWGQDDAPEFKDLSDRLLTFAIPATRTHLKNGTPDGKPEAVLIPLYTFVEQDWDFLTEYEVYGRFAFKSILESPPKVWVEKSKGTHEVLTVYTPIFPEEKPKEKTESQQARFRPLIQLWQPPQPDPRNGEPVKERQTNAEEKVKKIRTEEQSPPDSGTATEDFTKAYFFWLGVKDPSGPHVTDNKIPIRSIGLKQVRDALDTDRASYQAIVEVTRNIAGHWGYCPDYKSLEVRFYSYPPELTIHTTMGIDCKLNDEQGKDYAYYRAKTIPGARIYGRMNDENGKNLCWTIEKDKWQE